MEKEDGYTLHRYIEYCDPRRQKEEYHGACRSRGGS